MRFLFSDLLSGVFRAACVALLFSHHASAIPFLPSLTQPIRQEIAQVEAELASLPAAGLRITVIEPAANSTWWRASHVVFFSELYAYVGERNVTLNAPVEATSSNEFGYLWSTKCLTDGFTFFSPLFHDVEDPENNIFGHGLGKLEVEMDLGEVRQVDEFHLWPVVHEIQHNFPPSSGLGFPFSIRLEASQSADFSEAEVIYEDPNLDYLPGAGPFMHRTRPTRARFLRFTFANGLPSRIRSPATESHSRIVLSEIAILGDGKIISSGIHGWC